MLLSLADIKYDIFESKRSGTCCERDIDALEQVLAVDDEAFSESEKSSWEWKPFYLCLSTSLNYTRV